MKQNNTIRPLLVSKRIEKPRQVPGLFLFVITKGNRVNSSCLLDWPGVSRGPIGVGSRRALLVGDRAVVGAFLTFMGAFGSLRNGNILVTLGADRYTLALLLTFLDLILCHKSAFGL